MYSFELLLWTVWFLIVFILAWNNCRTLDYG